MLDISRHQTIFNPDDYAHFSIGVIGAGAVGSSIALGLAKLGLTNITVIDFDKVESHNLPNQYLYGPEDIGTYKVDAAESNIHQLTGATIKTCTDAYEGHKLSFDVVFMCVDSMKVRQLITNLGLYFNPYVKWAFDTRIDAHSSMSYAFEPHDMRQVAEFKEMLYDDPAVPEDRVTCGNTLSIGATAQIGSQTTIWMFMQALTGKLNANEVIHRVHPEWSTLSRKFESSRR